MHKTSEVVVAGAGPVGLFAAYALQSAGVAVEVFDTGIWPCAHTYGLAIHPRTVDLFREAAVAREALESGCAVHMVAVYDGQTRRAEVRADPTNNRPIIVLPQSVLESELEQALARVGVHVQWRHKIMRVETAGSSARVFLNRYEKESCGYVVARSEWVVADSWSAEVPFVIGADGHDSAVRRSMGIAFPQAAPCAWYAVFEFRSDADVRDEVRIVLGEKTTDVLWPLGDGWFRWSFQMPDYTDPDVERLTSYRDRFGEPSERVKDRAYGTTGDVNMLPDSRLAELVAERAPWFHGSINEVGWRTIVRFERRLADAFGKDRCWLAGDSAHLGAPMAVQSLNVGLAEARDLSAAIVAALRNGRGLEPLQEYQNRYLSEWKRLQAIELTVEAEKDVDPWIWDNRYRLLSCFPAHGPELSTMARQLGLRL